MKTNVRILEHDIADNIRVGISYPIDNIDKAIKDVFSLEDKKLGSLGGAQLSASKYYRRIAIVDAASLQSLVVVFDGTEWDTRATQ